MLLSQRCWAQTARILRPCVGVARGYEPFQGRHPACLESNRLEPVDELYHRLDAGIDITDIKMDVAIWKVRQ